MIDDTVSYKRPYVTMNFFKTTYLLVYIKPYFGEIDRTV